MSFDRSRLPEPLGYFQDIEGLRLTGRGKWRTTRCDFHGGSDSMRINVANGAWVCMSCGVKGGDVIAFGMQRHGFDFVQACKLAGAWVDDGKTSSAKPLPFSARSALEVLRAESLLCAVTACNLAKGCELASADRERLVQAAGRIRFISEEVSR